LKHVVCRELFCRDTIAKSKKRSDCNGFMNQGGDFATPDNNERGENWFKLSSLNKARQPNQLWNSRE
jgi:hypothetical protein